MNKIGRLEAELRQVREELAQVRQVAAGRAAAQGLLSAFLSLEPVALTMFDREMRFVKVSETWTRRTGLTEAEVLGRSLYEVIPWAKNLRHLHQRCMAGECCTADDVASTHTRRRPSYLRLEMAPWTAADGTIGGVVVLTYDITDIFNARETVRRSEQRLTLALEISDSVVWEVSIGDKRLFVAGAIASIYDEPPTYEGLTQDPFALVCPEDRPRVEAAWRAHIDQGRPYRTEYRIARRDGSEIWVDAVAETLRNEAGELDRIVGVMRNITQRKHDQMVVAGAREAAEAANRAKSEFLANMSHEIRTPLNGVMGVAGALARTPLNDAQQDMVELIESSAQTLERLLTDILDLSRIEAGRFEIKQEAFDLDETLHGVSALFEPKARERGVGFTMTVSPDCHGRFVGDALRLRQILSNLLSNAVKFTEVGEVRLRIERADAQRVRFAIEDTGIGFDRDAAHRLFERFEQADGSITRRFGGSGLGLSISRSLAEHMGGTLAASSEPGRGSVFTLVVPLERADAPAASSRETPAAKATAAGCCVERPPRVLLAEDHPTNRKVVELILGAAGVDLVSVVNGAEAVEAATAGRFDLILMDMQMPVMDGLTAIRAIRAQEKSRAAPPVPILALTANAMPEHIRASLEAGAGGHITKPITAKVLLAAMAQACAQGPSSRARAS